MDPSASQFASEVCQNPECKKQATLQCPTCIKLGLPPSFFCDQVCFKDFWNIHKLFHKKKEVGLDDGFKYTGPMRPFPRSFQGHRKVPDSIKRPDYATTGEPNRALQIKYDKFTHVNEPEEIEKIRLSCKLGRQALDLAHKAVAPGVTTEELDRIVHEFIIENDAYPSPLNYHNYPRSICTSVNEIICHGIPDTRPLQDGDIVNLDVSVYKDGFHADLNETVLVGTNVAESSRSLVENTYIALEKAIAYCAPKSMYREIGNIIANHCESVGLSVVRTYNGHGVGTMFHQSPYIPHYSKNKSPGFMKPGHIFTIEPMINMGDWRDVTWKDQWTSATVDGQRSAQFEHTILITEDGHEVLTARTASSPPLEFLSGKK